MRQFELGFYTFGWKCQKPVDLIDSINRFSKLVLMHRNQKRKKCARELNQNVAQFRAHYHSELVVTSERVGDLRRLWEEAAEYYLVHILRQNKLSRSLLFNNTWITNRTTESTSWSFLYSWDREKPSLVVEKASVQGWFSSRVGRRSLRASRSSSSRMFELVSSTGNSPFSGSQNEFLLASTAPTWEKQRWNIIEG